MVAPSNSYLNQSNVHKPVLLLWMGCYLLCSIRALIKIINYFIGRRKHDFREIETETGKHRTERNETWWSWSHWIIAIMLANEINFHHCSAIELHAVAPINYILAHRKRMKTKRKNIDKTENNSIPI